MADIILASTSPRRRELLALVCPDFRVVPAETDEDTDIKEPDMMVAELSRRKAMAVREEHRDSIVIGADTVVAADGKVLGKPEDEEDAYAMLRLLSGRTHQVYTGVTVAVPGREPATFTERTDVTFAELTDDEIREYIATGEPMDKAGAYGIQHYGSRFVESVRGDYFCVVGLPVQKLYRCLRDLDPAITLPAEAKELLPDR